MDESTQRPGCGWSTCRRTGAGRDEAVAIVTARLKRASHLPVVLAGPDADSLLATRVRAVRWSPSTQLRDLDTREVMAEAALIGALEKPAGDPRRARGQPGEASSTSTSVRPRRTSTASSTRPSGRTRCCSSTRPTRCSASAARSTTRTTATPTSRSPTCCSGWSASTASRFSPPTCDRTSTTRSSAGSLHRRLPARPRADARIWRQCLPGRRLPLDDAVDLPFLVETFNIAGGAIRNWSSRRPSWPPTTTRRRR